MVTKEELINLIIEHNPSMKSKELEDWSVESLVILKVQIELEHYRETTEQAGD